MAENKTNVMRILEQHKISYTAHEYPHGKEAVDGVSVAQLLGQNPAQVFKTLVARGKSGNLHVFCIPVAEELNLKKAAKAAGEKAVEMIHVKELLDRLCARRLFTGRPEKAVPGHSGRECERFAHRHRQRRQNRLPDRTHPRRPDCAGQRPNSGHHGVKVRREKAGVFAAGGAVISYIGTAPILGSPEREAGTRFARDR